MNLLNMHKYSKSHFIEWVGGDYSFDGVYRLADSVILGACSNGMLTQAEGGVCNKTLPHFETFAQHLPNADEGEKGVILLSSCCGQYEVAFIERLKDYFPHIVWLTPEISSWHGSFDPPIVTTELLRLRVLNLKGV